mmetsp:Transcript_43956/g.133910  ORF Transcript_43956/g.133910 Transcript_43956/m.133910 type:complete len:548 (-) Transcript_43956:119-1762(-)
MVPRIRNPPSPSPSSTPKMTRGVVALLAAAVVLCKPSTSGRVDALAPVRSAAPPRASVFPTAASARQCSAAERWSSPLLRSSSSSSASVSVALAASSSAPGAGAGGGGRGRNSFPNEETYPPPPPPSPRGRRHKDQRRHRDPSEFDGPTYRSNLRIADLAARSSKGDPNAASEAESILMELERDGLADTVSYNGVINAYAKCGAPGGGDGDDDDDDGMKRTETVLRRMENAHREQIQALREWEREREREDAGDIPAEGEEGEEEEDLPPRVRVRPNVRTYTTIMDAYVRRIPGRYGPEDAEALLERMRALAFATRASTDFDDDDDDAVSNPNLSLEPNTITYNTLLNAHAKSNRGLEGALRASELLEEMESEEKADAVSYNTVLDAWARSGADDAGRRAEEVLRKMIERGEAGAGPRPNMRSYSTVIDAHSRSSVRGSAQSAHEILRELEDAHESSGDPSLRPNAYAYCSVMNAYAKSSDAVVGIKGGKAAAALGILRRMRKLSGPGGGNPGARPNIVAYNTVLNACAATGSGGGGGGGEKEERWTT